MKFNEVKQNELEVKNYDVRRNYGTDWVTEFTFISETSLSLKQFQEMLEGQAYGVLTYIKRVLRFGNGKILYKHTCKAVMY